MGDTVTTSELTFFPAGSGGPAFAADVVTAVRPSSPRDPIVYEYWWSQPDENWILDRFVVSRGGRRIGYATAEHPRWEVQPERYGTVGGELLPAERTAATLDALFEAMEKRVMTDGARVLGVYAYENDALRIRAVGDRGYKEDRRSRRWQLDLVAGREKLLAMVEVSRERMRSEGVRLLTLAEDDDPAVVEKVWRLAEEAGA